MVSSIEKLLSKRVEEHQEELRNVKYVQIEENLQEFAALPEILIKDCEEKIALYNNTIDKINELVIQKYENVYQPIKIEKLNLKEKYDNCVSALEDLEKARLEYNKTATDTTVLTNKLKIINNEIAYYDVIDSSKKYTEKNNEKIIEEGILKSLVGERDAKKIKLDELEAKKKNASIAMKAINEDLAYIFFSKKRLQIDYKNEKYILYSNGISVEPSNVSVGERNAIGLCYFFNHIMEDKDEEEVYKQAYLLVIDDPISSFDTENRIGILSYLKYKLGQFLIGNKDSRFLLMTHDLQTFYDIRHLMEEIVDKLFTTPNILPGKPVNYIVELELSNKVVEKTDICRRSEYTALFEVVFKYGVDIDPTYTNSIGNIMRKVMEAFGTFIYKKGMSQLSTNEQILSILKQDERDYFENLMYRLVLNTGSHMEEQAMTIEDMKFFDFISDIDKQRTARDIICFLYKLNPLHVMAHLKDCDDVENTINKWCAAISN